MNEGTGLAGFQKILAIKLRGLGDTALWTSSLQALREGFPQARIEALVLAESEPLLRDHPAVDRIHTLTTASGLNVLAKLFALRKEAFDLALGFHATTSLCRYIKVMGAREVVLHHHSWKVSPKASTLAVPRPGNLEDALSRDFQLLSAVGLDARPPHPKLVPNPKENKEGRVRVSLAFGGKIPKGLLALLPGARDEIRRYPRDLWLSALNEILEEKNWTPIVLSDALLSKAWGLRKVCQDLKVPLLDDLSLREFMSVLSQCEAALGNDSGPIHIASALGLKTLTLFGPGCFGDWHPYDEQNHAALRISVDCRAKGPRDNPLFQYCTLSHCSHLSCLRRISPQEILRKLDPLALLP